MAASQTAGTGSSPVGCFEFAKREHKSCERCRLVAARFGGLRKVGHLRGETHAGNASTSEGGRVVRSPKGGSDRAVCTSPGSGATSSLAS